MLTRTPPYADSAAAGGGGHDFEAPNHDERRAPDQRGRQRERRSLRRPHRVVVARAGTHARRRDREPHSGIRGSGATSRRAGGAHGPPPRDRARGRRRNASQAQALDEVEGRRRRVCARAHGEQPRRGRDRPPARGAARVPPRPASDAARERAGAPAARGSAPAVDRGHLPAGDEGAAEPAREGRSDRRDAGGELRRPPRDRSDPQLPQHPGRDRGPARRRRDRPRRSRRDRAAGRPALLQPRQRRRLPDRRREPRSRRHAGAPRRQHRPERGGPVGPAARGPRRPRRRSPVGGGRPAQPPRIDHALRAAGRPRGAQAPDRRFDSGPRLDAHAWGLRPGVERARLAGADPRVGDPVRLRPAAVHAVRGRARAADPQPGQRPGAAARGAADADGGRAPGADERRGRPRGGPRSAGPGRAGACVAARSTSVAWRRPTPLGKPRQCAALHPRRTATPRGLAPKRFPQERTGAFEETSHGNGIRPDVDGRLRARGADGPRPGEPAAPRRAVHREGRAVRFPARFRDLERARDPPRRLHERDVLVAGRLDRVRPHEVRPPLQGSRRGDRARLPDAAQLRRRRTPVRDLPPAREPDVPASRRALCPLRRPAGDVARSRRSRALVAQRAAPEAPRGGECRTARGRDLPLGRRARPSPSVARGRRAQSLPVRGVDRRRARRRRSRPARRRRPRGVMPALGAIDDPPGDVRAAIAQLRDTLAGELPGRDAGHLLIGTWNIRAFGGLTDAWSTGPRDSPKRNLADVCAIAEIVQRFDVCALQETRGDLTALRTLLRRLGPEWGMLITDTGEGAAANDERLAYVFDRRSVDTSGLAGELVIDDASFGDAATPPRHQFARPPFMVSFEAGPVAARQRFTLVSLLIDYGENAVDRTPEIATFANRLRDRALDDDEFDRNLIALGDFNIDRWDDPNGRAFVSAGLTPPAELLDQPRSIFDRDGKKHFYDQIAWFTAGDEEALRLRYTRQAGRIEWTKYLLRDMSAIGKSWRISDHYPLWAQFALT